MWAGGPVSRTRQFKEAEELSTASWSSEQIRSYCLGGVAAISSDSLFKRPKTTYLLGDRPHGHTPVVVRQYYPSVEYMIFG